MTVPLEEVIRRPRLGAAGLVERDDHVLLGVRDKDPNRGRWIIPGGKIEPGESPEMACIRELYEETGARITPTEFAGAWTINEGDDHWIVLLYRATAVRWFSEPANQAASDLRNPCWVRRDELPGLTIAPVCVAMLEATGWLVAEADAAPSGEGRS